MTLLVEETPPVEPVAVESGVEKNAEDVRGDDATREASGAAEGEGASTERSARFHDFIVKKDVNANTRFHFRFDQPILVATTVFCKDHNLFWNLINCKKL